MNKEMNDKLIEIGLLNYNKIELDHDTDFDDEMNEVDVFCFFSILKDHDLIICELDYSNIYFDVGHEYYYPKVTITNANDYVSFVNMIRSVVNSDEYILMEHDVCCSLENLDDFEEAHKPLIEYVDKKVEEWKNNQ